MAFTQETLAELAYSTLQNVNLFSYQSSDNLATVTGVGYFTDSRFIDTEYGWADSIIISELSDGFFMLKVATSEITVTQVGAGGSDITTLQSDVADLTLNLRDVEAIDMNADDLVLTATQAKAAVLVVTNVGDGTKTLTWPTGAENPAQQLVVTLTAANFFDIAHEAGGVTASMEPGTMHIVSVTSTYGAYDIDEFTGSSARGESNGVVTLGAGDTVLADTHAGKLLIAADGAAQTLTVNTGLLTNNMKLTVYCSGAGGMTVTAGTGTVNGNAVLAAGDSCVIYRDALTDTYTCV